MPRKGHVPKRDPIADPIYSSTLVTKFVNAMMWGGKKSTAQGIFYKCMENLQAKGGDEALKLFKKAVENAKPMLEVKTRRVGGANYQVPKKAWWTSSPTNYWTRPMVAALPSRKRKMSTAWLKPTRRSRITGGREDFEFEILNFKF